MVRDDSFCSSSTVRAAVELTLVAAVTDCNILCASSSSCTLLDDSRCNSSTVCRAVLDDCKRAPAAAADNLCNSSTVLEAESIESLGWFELSRLVCVF